MAPDYGCGSGILWPSRLPDSARRTSRLTDIATAAHSRRHATMRRPTTVTPPVLAAPDDVASDGSVVANILTNPLRCLAPGLAGHA